MQLNLPYQVIRHIIVNEVSFLYSYIYKLKLIYNSTILIPHIGETDKGTSNINL